jgi:hypothetical protein
MNYEKQTTLHLVAATFSLFKALEYSVRGVTIEMVCSMRVVNAQISQTRLSVATNPLSHSVLIVIQLYVSLDYESRFVGKEIIGLFVNRLGKSGMAVILSLVTSLFGSSPILDKAFVQALSVSSFLWLFASYPLIDGKEKLH